MSKVKDVTFLAISAGFRVEPHMDQKWRGQKVANST